ncbi:hypothetical protein FrCorBMG51_00840 [Protofrankia coriariae]|uniref:Chromosomal replication initiator protein n=1 Tax=Protofrankia coriariae TaxID=1562887 RepID=A0ABR5F8X4_9ACTN|nr:hypothetical protein FrCorBMG51_00840 [Protofrankia coriariae]
MKTLIVAPRRVRRSTSARVSSRVSGTGGQEKEGVPLRIRCAVGSPSVITRTTGSESGCRDSSRPASIRACWRFVPWTTSESRPASSTGRSSRA